jgi:hypothetical protein
VFWADRKPNNDQVMDINLLVAGMKIKHNFDNGRLSPELDRQEVGAVP